MSILGRRNMQKGDVAIVDTPYINGIADIIGGPNTELGTKTYPKYLYKFRQGKVFDPTSGFTAELNSEDEIWLEDNPNYVSIIGVDVDYPSANARPRSSAASVAPSTKETLSGLSAARARRESTRAAEADTVVYLSDRKYSRKEIGRVDKDGRVLKGENELRCVQVGRVDQDGTVFRGDTLWNEKMIGRVYPDGTILQGTNSWNEKVIGAVDSYGIVSQGKTTWRKNKIGLVEGPRNEQAGAALLLLLQD